MLKQHISSRVTVLVQTYETGRRIASFVDTCLENLRTHINTFLRIWTLSHYLIFTESHASLLAPKLLSAKFFSYFSYSFCLMFVTFEIILPWKLTLFSFYLKSGQRNFDVELSFLNFFFIYRAIDSTLKHLQCWPLKISHPVIFRHNANLWSVKTFFEGLCQMSTPKVDNTLPTENLKWKDVSVQYIILKVFRYLFNAISED